MIAVLHNIRSLHNVGSIFRTSDGISKIFLCGYTPAPFDEFGLPVGPLVKTALGAEKYLEWEKRGSTIKLLNELKKQGYRLYAIEQGKGSIRADRLKLSKKEFDRPMRGKKESLNVAVAFGIVAYSVSERI